MSWGMICRNVFLMVLAVFSLNCTRVQFAAKNSEFSPTDKSFDINVPDNNVPDNNNPEDTRVPMEANRACDGGYTLDWYKIEVNFVESIANESAAPRLRLDGKSIYVTAKTKIKIQATQTPDTWEVIDGNGLDDGEVIIRATAFRQNESLKLLWGTEINGREAVNQTAITDANSVVDVTDSFLKVITNCNVNPPETKSMLADDLQDMVWKYRDGFKSLRMYLGEIK